MNKLLKFLMPKTARRIDKQQREIAELEKANAYLKTRLGSKDDIREKKPVRNGLVSTSVTSKSSPVTSANSPVRSSVDTFTPTAYSDSSYSSYSSSSCDSDSCCSDSCCSD
jgi:hypothetical protein